MQPSAADAPGITDDGGELAAIEAGLQAIADGIGTSSAVAEDDGNRAEENVETGETVLLSEPEAVVEHFETSLEDELAKLRAAIAALDQAFLRPATEAAGEPSFADLVSDTALKAAS